MSAIAGDRYGNRWSRQSSATRNPLHERTHQSQNTVASVSLKNCKLAFLNTWAIPCINGDTRCVIISPKLSLPWSNGRSNRSAVTLPSNSGVSRLRYLPSLKDLKYQTLPSDIVTMKAVRTIAKRSSFWSRSKGKAQFQFKSFNGLSHTQRDLNIGWLCPWRKLMPGHWCLMTLSNFE